MRTIRIVAADDSAVMRRLLVRLFAGATAEAGVGLQLCATAPDGASCLHAVRTLHPDVVLLDLNMPGVGGLETIVRLRREWPRLPILMCSAATEDGAAATVEALACGASDYVTKPAGCEDTETAMLNLQAQLVPRIAALTMEQSRAGMHRASRCGAYRPMRMRAQAAGIGASTGGPAALERLLTQLPEDFPLPVLVAQHMPKLFTSALAARLDRCCAMRVKQATAGALLHPGTIWIAPGDSHMEVTMGPRGVASLALHRGECAHGCRPAVDVLFRSLAKVFGAGAAGLVLTGMGADGMEGAMAIADAGGVVLAQDEASSAVWGMPGRVVNAGLADAVLPLDGLAGELMRLASAGFRADAMGSVMERREFGDGAF